MDIKSGLLEDIYFGKFNKELLNSIIDRPIGNKAKKIVGHFLEIIKKYDPVKIEESGIIPDELWQTMKQIGLFGLTIPEKFGGQGLSLRDYLYVIEVLAGKDMSLALIPLAHLSIGLKGLLLFGSQEQKFRYLPEAATGEKIFAYVLTEPKTGSDAQHIETTAILSADKTHYVLNGTKTYITNGGYAQALTVFAQLDSKKAGNMGAFIVETNSSGVKIGKDMKKMGLTVSSTTSVSFKDVRVPVDNMLGSPGQGFKIAMTILNYGRLGLGAASHGVMEQSIRDMITRSKKRIQFQVPISNFELVQEKIVEALVNSFIANAITSLTAAILEKNPLAHVPIESSHCKLFGTTRAWDTLYNAQQVAGGAGYIKTLPYEKRLRDFRATTLFEGTTEIHSIYPALMIIRQLVKEMKRQRMSKLDQILYLIKRPFIIGDFSLDFKHRKLKKAEEVIQHHLKTINRMISFGMLIYGKKIINKEFYLRRITRLSISLFGLLSVSLRINTNINNTTDLDRKMNILCYMLEESKRVFKENIGFTPTKIERLHPKIIKILLK